MTDTPICDFHLHKRQRVIKCKRCGLPYLVTPASSEFHSSCVVRSNHGKKCVWNVRRNLRGVLID